MRRIFLTCSTILAASAALAAPAIAQEAPEAQATDVSSDEIIVTARKRVERLFDVPGAVSAIGGAQIDALRVQDARDLLMLTPNAFLQENNAGTARDISIRGVSTPSLFAEPGVAFYVDDVYASGFVSYPARFYDIERIEVLRGPQGGLYGRNAVGGAVNVLSRQPGETFAASASATFASHERTELEGMVNVPIGDKAGVRVAAWSVDQKEGDYFNPVTKRALDATEDTGGRMSFIARPTDTVTLSLVAETTGGVTPGTYLFFPTAGETKSTVRRDTQPVNDIDATRYSGKLEAETGLGVVTFVLGKRTYELSGVEDTDLSDQAAFGSPFAGLGQQITTRLNETDATFAEARWASDQFGAFSVLAGVTYLNEQATGDIATNLAGVSAAFTAGTLPAILAIANDQEVTSWSGFVEATLALSPTVSATGSLRYTEDEKTVDFAFAPSALLGAFGLLPQTLKRTKSFDNISPGVTVAWSPDLDTRVYAKVQTGFRAGGFNFNVGSVTNLPYDEEKSVNYEAGAKRRLANGKVTVGGSVFYLTQTDVLVPLFDFTQPGGLQGYLDNVGDAETLGAEIEGSIKVSDELTLGASIGYLDATFTSGTVSGTALDGKTLPSSRKLTYAVTAAYERPLSERMRVMTDISYSHRDSGFQDARNLFEIGAADLLNGSIGISFGRAELRAFVQNALNDDYEIAFGGFRAPAESAVILAPERTYGVTLRLSY